MRKQTRVHQSAFAHPYWSGKNNPKPIFGDAASITFFGHNLFDSPSGPTIRLPLTLRHSLTITLHHFKMKTFNFQSPFLVI